MVQKTSQRFKRNLYEQWLFAGSCEFVKVTNLPEELGLTSVARMPNLSYSTHIFQAVQRRRSVVTDRNKPFWTKQQDQLIQQFLTDFTFLRVMGPIGERIVGFVGMQREDVPKEDGFINLRKDIPDYRSCPLGNGNTPCRSRRRNTPTFGMGADMHVVGQCQTRSPPPPIAEVTSYPDRVNFDKHGGFKNVCQDLRPLGRGILTVKSVAPMRIRIERILELQCAQLGNELCWLHFAAISKGR